MKKLPLLIIVACCALNSCTHDDPVSPNVNSISKSLLDAAKDWHYQQTHQDESPLGRLSNEKKAILTPKFKQAKSKSFANDVLLYIPAMGFDLENDEVALVRGFIFQARGNKILDGKIVEIYSDPDYLSNHEDILERLINGKLGDFTGKIIFYDVNYNFVHGQIFQSGKRVRGVPQLGYKPMDATRQLSSGRTMDYMVDVYMVTYFSDGTQSWDYLYSYCVGCGGYGYGENPGSGYIDPSTQGLSSGHEEVIVENNVQTPCLADLIESIRSAELQNRIQQMFTQLFDNTTTLRGFIFTEGNNMTEPASTRVDSWAPLQITTTLNTAVLSNASEEYTTIVIYHEIVHGILYAQGKQGDLQHAEILENYINDLVNAAIDLYPNLSVQDARAIAMNGLANISGSQAYQDVAANFGLTLTTIAQISLSYRRDNRPGNQPNGTPCGN